MNPANKVDEPHDPLQLRTLAWLFGDDEEDPGAIADEATRRDDMIPWLERLAADYRLLKEAAAPGRESLALARIEALRADIAQRRAGAVDWQGARAEPARADGANSKVRSLAAARARLASPTTNKLARGLLVGAFTAFAAAAIIFMVTRPNVAHPDVDARTAQVLLGDLAGDGGMGFAGAAPPSAHDRGFLLGAVIDLSRPRQDGAAPAQSEVVLARDLVERTLKGLAAPDDDAARTRRVLGGCGAILIDAGERAACERGLADYIARRDAFFSAR
jgi:hypothetical protein